MRRLKAMLNLAEMAGILMAKPLPRAITYLERSGIKVILPKRSLLILKRESQVFHGMPRSVKFSLRLMTGVQSHCQKSHIYQINYWSI